jgi:hypothetical protein
MHQCSWTSLARRLVAIASIVAAAACRESSAAERANAPRVLAVTILGDSSDPRIAPVREALAHWNDEFLRLGRQVRFDSATVRNDSVPDDILRAASDAVLTSGRALDALVDRVSGEPGDIVVALSHADLISFSVQWRSGRKGVVGLRRSDIPPLSLPNTVRNVAAHELGHVLGLSHNPDATTLMCGRPSPCRPAAFASATPRFFPLTTNDERVIRSRWP